MVKQIIVGISLLVGSTLLAQTPTDSKITKVAEKKKTLSNKKLVVFVSNYDLQMAGMGLGMALSAVKQGARVTVVMGADTVKYALAEGEQNVYFAKKRTPRALLKAIIKGGGVVELCSANTENMNLDEEDFIEGVKIVISTEIFAKVFDDNTRVISF